MQSSPEKECISINELVKKSVDKINNLFQHQKLSESDDKSFNSIINLNLNNRIKYRENTNFHTINTIEEINKYRSIKNEKQINERKSDDDLSENVQYTNSHSFVDVSALKRNIKQHSFDFKWLIVDDGSTDNTSILVKNWIIISTCFSFLFLSPVHCCLFLILHYQTLCIFHL